MSTTAGTDNKKLLEEDVFFINDKLKDFILIGKNNPLNQILDDSARLENQANIYLEKIAKMKSLQQEKMEKAEAEKMYRAKRDYDQ